MGRHCSICADGEKMRVAAEMVAAGRPDRVVAETLGDVSRMAVQRHRTGHMLRGKVGAVAAEREAAEQRQATLTAPRQAPFDAKAFLSLDRIAEDLDSLERQLNTAGMAAAVAGSNSALVAIAGQQLRLAETRAKLGEVGGYGRDRGNGGLGSGSFSIIMNFGGDRPPLTVSTTGQPHDDPGEAVEPVWHLPVPAEPDRHPLAAGGPAAIFRNMGPA